MIAGKIDERRGQDVSSLYLCRCINSSEPSPLVTTEHRDSAPSPGETFQDCDECPKMVVVPSGSFAMGSRAVVRGVLLMKGRCA